MSSEQSVVRVFLLTENRLLREVLARLLARKSDLEVVEVASLSEPAVLAEVSANLDVLLGDSLPDATSSDGTIQKLRRKLPNLKILMFGMDCEEEKFLSAIQHGVSGY